MKLRVFALLLPLSLSAAWLNAQAAPHSEKFSPPSRTFRFTYSFTLKDIPSGAKRVRV